MVWKWKILDSKLHFLKIILFFHSYLFDWHSILSCREHLTFRPYELRRLRIFEVWDLRPATEKQDIGKVWFVIKKRMPF